MGYASASEARPKHARDWTRKHHRQALLDWVKPYRPTKVVVFVDSGKGIPAYANVHTKSERDVLAAEIRTVRKSHSYLNSK
ncbi:MAG: hypothetical protein AAB573_03825 [Patescibacteria group bacterium]